MKKKRKKKKNRKREKKETEKETVTKTGTETGTGTETEDGHYRDETRRDHYLPRSGKCHNNSRSLCSRSATCNYSLRFPREAWVLPILLFNFQHTRSDSRP